VSLEPRSALVLGGTGLVGGHLLDLLLDDPGYARVVSLGRRAPERSHPKLEVRLAPLDGLEAAAGAFEVDDVFCALGTTLRTAGSREAFRAVDLDAVAASARLAARAGAGRYLLVSSVGADPRSPFFYLRVKGEAEAAVSAAGVGATAVLRPAQLLGARRERRSGEAAAAIVARVLAPLLAGPLRRWRAVPAETVARAMARLARELAPGERRVVENEEILERGG
jgi:uncharacterized protein YbjT (DUF2867 family)